MFPAVIVRRGSPRLIYWTKIGNDIRINLGESGITLVNAFPIEDTAGYYTTPDSQQSWFDKLTMNYSAGLTMTN
jgi:hypothetical protein